LDPVLAMIAKWRAERKRIDELNANEEDNSLALTKFASRIYRTVPQSKEGLCALLDMGALGNVRLLTAAEVEEMLRKR
jgi:hypothetical protein